jgi:cobalt-zinc-cadmium efflux system outer membrane protein
MMKSIEAVILLFAPVLGLALLSGAGCVTAPSVASTAAKVEGNVGGGFTLKTNVGALSLPPGIASLEHLSGDDAVAIALWNNAAFQEALAGLGFNRADLLQAKQLRNPSLVMLFPAGPKQLEFAALFPVESLWLRPRRVAVAEIDLEAAAGQLVASGLNLVRDVRVACAELELAGNRLRAVRDSVRWWDEAVKLTERRLELGDASALEFAQARADALVARQTVGRLERDQTLAHERLRALLGLANEPSSFSLRLAPVVTAPLPLQTELLKQALAARPELRANELVLEAARQRGQLAKGELVMVNAILDANDTSTGMQFGPGIDVTLPIFHQNQGARSRADTIALQAILRHITLRDRILLDVREAVVRRNQAVRELTASREHVVPALESAVAQARRAYELGDTAPQSILTAERRLADARAMEAESLAELRRAEAELARAIGRRFQD